MNIQLRGGAFIPETYIEDERAVLEFYRRLAAAKDEAASVELESEAAERFGPHAGTGQASL